MQALTNEEIARYRSEIFEARRAQGMTDAEIDAEIEEYASKGIQLYEHALLAQAA